MSEKDYILHEHTIAMCPVCNKVLTGKIIFEKDQVFVLRECPEHGEFKNILEHDKKYHLRKYLFDKPGTKSKINTKKQKGCPYDCGICPQHEQHTCIGLIEVTNRCDLKCKMCYADSGKDGDLDLNTIEKMMDFYQESEFGQAEILQISGGEPSMHPEIIRIIELARAKKFEYIMLNTNGVRIATDKEFVKALTVFDGGFEVYLQFDSLNDEAYKKIRGRGLFEIKKKAIKNLSKHKIPITLVMTIQGGVNDNEMGEIIEYALRQEYIRGINFQPQAYFGRYDNEVKHETISSIINKISKQFGEMLKPDDFVPLPCDTGRVAVSYLLKNKSGFIPLTRKFKVEEVVTTIDNTLYFDAKKIIKSHKQTSCCACKCMDFSGAIKKILPSNYLDKKIKDQREYINDNIFRITIKSFIDAYNFDIKSVQKDCVHVITPDLKRIPFSMYNLLHRKKQAS